MVLFAAIMPERGSSEWRQMMDGFIKEATTILTDPELLNATVLVSGIPRVNREWAVGMASLILDWHGAGEIKLSDESLKLFQNAQEL